MDNKMKLTFLARSENESFARNAIAFFALQLELSFAPFSLQS